MIQVIKEVDTPKKALIFLHDEAKKEDEELAAIIFSIKINNNYKQNYAALSKPTKASLIKTYAWLMKTNVDDDKVVQMNLQGIKKMILYRINQITADLCRGCNKVVHYRREEDYAVTCWECGRGACPDCYPSLISVGKNWRFLCHHCLDTIGKLRGFEALQDTDFLKVKKSKKATKDADEAQKDDNEEEDEEVEDTAEPKEGDESPDDSCVFVTDVATQDDGENREENPNHAFVEQPTRGFKAKNNKPATTEPEKSKQKDKTCNFFLQGRCHWGMSGRKPRKNLPDSPKECPYAHPRVCTKLLHHGDGKHTSYGCDGKSCKKAHPKMCVSSMKSRVCGKSCKNGFHLKGTTFDDKVPLQSMSKKRSIKLQR